MEKTPVHLCAVLINFNCSHLLVHVWEFRRMRIDTIFHPFSIGTLFSLSFELYCLFFKRDSNFKASIVPTSIYLTEPRLDIYSLVENCSTFHSKHLCETSGYSPSFYTRTSKSKNCTTTNEYISQQTSFQPDLYHVTWIAQFVRIYHERITPCPAAFSLSINRVSTRKITSHFGYVCT